MPGLGMAKARGSSAMTNRHFMVDCSQVVVTVERQGGPMPLIYMSAEIKGAIILVEWG